MDNDLFDPDEPSTSAAPAVPPAPQVPADPQDIPGDQNSDSVPSLDPVIVDLLGEDPTKQQKFGEDLHKDIASRWSYILTNGLSKETQVELTKHYLPPENCLSMKAPILNLEIKAALVEANIKKDLYSQTKQNQLSSSLAAIGQVLNWALASKDVPQDIIKTLSDAGRLICDNHYRESLSRRFAVLNTLNKDVRDTIKNTRIDDHLFGSALADHIKSSKAIIKTGTEMKSVVQRPQYKTTAFATQRQRGTLNYRGAPPRVAAAEPRPPPAARRPPRDRRLEAPRGRRRSTGHSHHHARRRYQ